MALEANVWRDELEEICLGMGKQKTEFRFCGARRKRTNPVGDSKLSAELLARPQA
jgi:hypothetical protein